MTSKISHEERLAIYERQTSYVQTVIDQHPEYLRVLSLEEQSIFQRFFLPDWVEEGNFVQYYEQVQKSEPDLVTLANELLQKFLDANGLKMP